MIKQQMQSNHIISLLILIWTSACCDLTLSGSKIRVPKEALFTFSGPSETKGSLCFQFSVPFAEERAYLVRLDYLPYTCLDASNDIKLEWTGQKYTAHIDLSRKCKRRTLKEDQDEGYRLIYQFRRGYSSGGILVESEIVERYLPALLLMFIASIFIQKGVFTVTLADKVKGR